MKKYLLLILVLLSGGCARAQGNDSPTGASPPPGAAPGKIRVLTISGDWKSQPWYQAVVAAKGGPALMRGRFIADEVEKAAPGRFAFTDITNYIGQQYGDEVLFEQYDVVLIGDIVGWSLPPRFEEGLKKFVQNGGGFMYCGSYKWHMALLQNTPFEEVLPARFPADGFRDDWKNADLVVHEMGFKPQLASDHPVTRGLDWASAPALDASGKMLPRPASQVLLKTPGGAPLLAAWTFGKGRALFSPSIFANDEASTEFGKWKDFGKFYAQAFAWLGSNHVHSPQPASTATTVRISVDTTQTANAVGAKLFSIHGASNNPGLVPLEGAALNSYDALNLADGWERIDVGGEVEPQNDNDDPHVFNRAAFHFEKLDAELAQARRLKLEPVLLFPFNYGKPDWLWDDAKLTWQNASPRSAEELAELVAATLDHVNGAAAGGKLTVHYVEVLNEPNVDDKNMDSFVRLVRAVAQRVHREYPGVLVGAFGNHETPYLKTFLKKIDPDLDWISSHPYGWTGEAIFRWQDEVTAYEKEQGLRPLPFFITEWDFWIQGRDKFDYMMQRNFAAARRENLMGTLHYRLGQYAEALGLDPRRQAVYMFGVLWLGYGAGAGEKGAPMHDAYDAFWLWRDFRGDRAKVTAVGDAPSLHTDAVRTAGGANVVLYNDWRGQDASVTLDLALAPSPRARTVTVSRATGEGFDVLPQTATVPPYATHFQQSLELRRLSGISVTVQ